MYKEIRVHNGIEVGVVVFYVITKLIIQISYKFCFENSIPIF